MFRVPPLLQARISLKLKLSLSHAARPCLQHAWARDCFMPNCDAELGRRLLDTLLALLDSPPASLAALSREVLRVIGRLGGGGSMPGR